jgi:acetyl-CoA carboxylase biotin carboxylase subunit
MFSKILIANRGEIAVRIIRACKEMGIATVAVYSEADLDSLHAALAEERYCIGPAAAEDSYLNPRRILSAALISGAQAIHPGYGFLSENADFARECRRNGIVFIGPEPELMERLGDKTEMKRLVEGTSLRPIPGTGVLRDMTDALARGEELGYPLMLKARSGGGGRGIRLLQNAEDLCQAWPLAVAECASAFGDGALYLEKYIWPARHIEVQVLADEQGNAVCLGERDCSVQRRHQKLIEESPSPGVSRKQREALMAGVREAVQKIGYTGVGTMEFLLDKAGNFWFMEMNVRLQVEHPVTEMLTMLDLVKWQIRTAAGIPLRFSQEQIVMEGSAMECRINALAPGRLGMLHVPGGHFVRFDTYLVQGVEVSPYYDPLVGKLIVYARSREEAVRKLKAALCELVIEGIPTNIEEQLRIISGEPFMRGSYDLTLMEGR